MDGNSGGLGMKVSVIVPVYNVEPYLKKCLDSLVHQTLNEIEILVVNDGSPDHSQKIIDEYAKNYPEKVRSFMKENGGQGSARNLALGYAKGEYIGFVDSDDWVDLTMYEEMYQKAMKEQADIVICNTVDHYDDYEVYHTQSDVGKFRKCGSVCNKIFRRTLIGDSRFPAGLWYEDFCFGIKLLMQTEKVVYCKKHFYHALNREGSTMNNNNARKNLDMLRVMDEIVNFAKEKGLYEQYAYDLEYMMIEHILITSINRVAEQKNTEKRKIINTMRKYVCGHYPDFRKDAAFREFNKNQKIVAILNAKGLYFVAQMLLKMKRLLKKQ